MTLTELIEEAAKRRGVSKKVAAEVVKELLSVMTEALGNGETVKFTGYGVFKIVSLSPRIYFGGKRVSGPRSTVRFQTSRRSKWRSTPSSKKRRS